MTTPKRFTEPPPPNGWQTSVTILDPSRHGWMRLPATRKVMAALAANTPEGSARFVGGAVRNALMGCPVDDIDIAAPYPPETVIRRLTAAGIKAVPTGLAYGTVTAVCGGRPFEITSLRRDVRTDGRHATVAFGTDWREDAMRRDFTINALYVASDGTLFDYVGGLDDIAARRLRFIGDPAARIREDYLRVLRLFRFAAWYGGGAVDPDALGAATAARDGLAALSGERIAKEMLKLLAARDPLPVLRAMAEAGILAAIRLSHADLARLGQITAIDRRNGFAPDEILRLAALLPDLPSTEDLATAWKLSKAQARRLACAAAPHPTAEPGIHPAMPHGTARQRLYRMGAQSFNDRLMLAWAKDASPANDAAWLALLELGEMFAPPHFPLSGRDAIALGVPAGPGVRSVLQNVENWWIEHDFPAEPAILMARLKTAALQAAGRQSDRC